MSITRGILALAAVVAAALPARADDKPAPKAEAKPVGVAHLKLSGGMAEKAPVVDPLLGQMGDTFKGTIDRIKKTAKDGTVKAVLLEINGLGTGWGKLDELTAAIASVRATGRKVYAYVESGSPMDYYVALACDDICVPEQSWVMLTGIRAEVTFYANLFAKIGVQADFLHMGDFKGAAEPYTRTSLSEPNRKQITSIVDDHFDKDIVERILKSRKAAKLTADRVKELIDNGPHSAKAAVAGGFIDRVGYRDTYEAHIKADLKAAEIKVVENYGKQKDADLDIFSLYRKLIFGPTKAFASKSPKVAIIYVTGAIMTGKSGGGLLGGETVGSDTIVEAIQTADKDESVKAIVLRVDSPGGSAVASDLIWNALKKTKKPVIASMSDVAGSGGYYVCIAAKKIYAEPGTLTGSIGVVGGKMALKGVYDKVGITTDVISRGKNAGLLSTTEPFSPTQKQAFKALMEDCYVQFVDKAVEGRVAAGKKMTREDLLPLAGGRIYTGRQAKANGLIDELGTLEDAIAYAAKEGGIKGATEPELLMLPKPRGALESLLEGGGLGAKIDVTKLLKDVPGIAAQLKGADALLGLSKEPVWAVMPFRLDVK